MGVGIFIIGKIKTIVFIAICIYYKLQNCKLHDVRVSYFDYDLGLPRLLFHVQYSDGCLGGISHEAI